MDINWIDEYERLMFGEPGNLELVQKAQDIKYKNMPDTMFKYRLASDIRHIDSLEKNNLYFSLPDTMPKDPNESRILLELEENRKRILNRVYHDSRSRFPELPNVIVNDEKDIIEIADNTFRIRNGNLTSQIPSEIKKMLINMLKERTDAYLNDSICKFKNMYSICCLTDSYDNDYMWNEYGGNHTGFCIEYDIKGNGQYSNIVTLALPIIYRDDNYPKFDWEAYTAMSDIQAGSFGMHALTIKPENFSQEREWRIFQLQSPKSYPVNMPAIKKVYLGKRIEKENADKIISICDKKEIEVVSL